MKSWSKSSSPLGGCQRGDDPAWFDLVSKPHDALRQFKFQRVIGWWPRESMPKGLDQGLGFLAVPPTLWGRVIYFGLLPCLRKPCFSECVWTLLTLIWDSQHQRGAFCSGQTAAAHSDCSLKFLFLFLRSGQFLINLPGRMRDSAQACKWLTDTRTR